MTWSEYMKETCGYETKTTFYDDFSIADRCGISEVKDTFKRIFEESKINTVHATELAMVLNHKIWRWCNQNRELANVYHDLYEEVDEWCWDNLKGEDLDYYYHTTD